MQKLSEEIYNNVPCINHKTMKVDVELQGHLSVFPKRWSTFICLLKCGNKRKQHVVTGRYANVPLDWMWTLCNRNHIGEKYH